MKDISRFKVGDVVESFMTGIKYKVLHYNFTVKNNKRVVESSTCTNLETGTETIITWHKNENSI